MQRPHVLLCPDSGPGVGAGHVVRCGALSSALRSRGFVTSVCLEVGSPLEPVVKPYADRIAWVESGSKGVFDLFERECDYDLAVVDSYVRDSSWMETLRRLTGFLVAVDDEYRMTYPADVVVNGNVYADRHRLESSVAGAKILAGPTYCLLRPEYAARSEGHESADENTSDSLQSGRVLVTVGGSDPLMLTPKILMALEPLEVTADVVIGPGFDPDDVATLLGRYGERRQGSRYVFHHRPSSLVDLMRIAVIAVSAGGSTLYEMAAVGLPGIALLQAANQIPLAEAMAERGTIVNLGMGNQVDVVDLRRAVQELLMDRPRRLRMAKAGAGLIDGHGAGRVSDVIKEEWLRRI